MQFSVKLEERGGGGGGGGGRGSKAAGNIASGLMGETNESLQLGT